ncbi:MFS transporter [Microbacterium sp. LWH13-1.2]|uniref:MFS transporter n=1 Tax=Microbacterium sp. LWH13-1.2 TaxID=3135260 RepID=UPI003139C782
MNVPPPTTVDGDGPKAPPIATVTTPFGRVMVAMISSYMGGVIALSVPVSVLLTLKLVEMVGQDGVPLALGVITGCGAATGFFVNPIAGRISDRTQLRFGRRRTWILAGGLAGACALSAIWLTTEVWQIVVLWCLVEIFIGFQMSVTGALMVDQVPAAKRGSISGVLGLIVATGPLLGLAIITPLSGAAQWIAIAALAAIGAAIAILLLRESPLANAPSPITARQLLSSFWVSPRRHPAFAYAWMVKLFVGAVGAAGAYNGVFLLQRIGTSTEELAATILGISFIFVGVGGTACLLAGIVSDRLRRQKPFVMMGGVLGAGGLVVLAFADALPAVYLSTAISAVGAGIFLSVDTALSSRMLPRAEDIGKDLGVMSLAGTIPASAIPFIAPLLLAIGGFTLLYLLLAVLGLIGGLLVLRLPELGKEGDPRWAQLTVTR